VKALPEIELAIGTLVVADLHLDTADEGGDLASFCIWLEGLEEVPRLVILGDLFEYWFGPAQEASPGASRVLDALARRVASGTRIDLVPGNRDFLLGQSFEARTGARVRREGFVGVLEESAVRALFLHGDVLCTADRGYQALRRVLRSGPVRWLGPRLPRSVGEALARHLRRASARAIAAKAPLEVQLQEEACRSVAGGNRCSTVVCGHAHLFRDDALEGGPRWLVLDAFGGERDALAVTAGGGLEARRTTTEGGQ